MNLDYGLEMAFRHYIEPKLPAGERIYRSVRVKNAGNFTWSTQTPLPYVLSYHWVDAFRAEDGGA